MLVFLPLDFLFLFQLLFLFKFLSCSFRNLWLPLSNIFYIHQLVKVISNLSLFENTRHFLYLSVQPFWIRNFRERIFTTLHCSRDSDQFKNDVSKSFFVIIPIKKRLDWKVSDRKVLAPFSNHFLCHLRFHAENHYRNNSIRNRSFLWFLCNDVFHIYTRIFHQLIPK